MKILDILEEVGPVNMGFYGLGNIMGDIHMEDIKRSIHDNSRLRCCFDSRHKVKEVLQRIKSEDLGLSITISGPVDEIMDIASELSLKPHTVNLSCGVFGRVDRLPGKEIQEISSMCGHGMIGHRYAGRVIQKVKSGEVTVDEAVRILGKPCTCGIFNPSRAKKTLKSIVEGHGRE
jgi:hypothetical protein